MGQVEFTTNNYDRRSVLECNDHRTVSERSLFPDSANVRPVLDLQSREAAKESLVY